MCSARQGQSLSIGCVMPSQCKHSRPAGFSPLTLNVCRELCLCRKSHNLEDGITEPRFKVALSMLLYIFGLVAGVNLSGGDIFFMLFCFWQLCEIFLL